MSCTALTNSVCFAQITHSIPFWAIPAVLLANSLSLLLYNVAGMAVFLATPPLLLLHCLHWQGVDTTGAPCIF